MNAELEIEIRAIVNEAIANFGKVDKSLEKVNATAKKSSKDFTGLSRVIQDLPFGLIGIQNNITQLVPSAGYLGLAISAVTAAVTFAQVGFSNWTRGLGKTKEEVDEISKSLAGAQTEIVKVSSLLSIARGLSESTEARKNAIKELQQEYPGYLKNLTLENINSQETSHAVDLLAQALTRKAKVQAISNLLTKANEKLLQAESATIAENIVSVKSFLSLLKGGILTPGTAGGALVRGATKETVDNIANAVEEVKSLSNALAELTQEQARNNELELLNPTSLKKSGEKSAKNWYDAWKKEMTRLNTQGIVLGSFQKEINNLFAGPQGKLTAKPSIVVSPELDEETKEKFKALTTTVSGIVDNFATGLGETIGAALSGKGDLFGGFLKLLGDSISAIGKYVIAASTLLAKIKTALTAALAGTPALGLAVGIGLVALGAALRNIPKFATGGVVTSPTLALVGERGPERITPLGYEGANNAVMQGEVIFTISGQTLRGILKRADQSAYNTF